MISNHCSDGTALDICVGKVNYQNIVLGQRQIAFTLYGSPFIRQMPTPFAPNR